MNRVLVSIVAVVAAVNLIACGKSQQIHGAPQSQKEAGLIIKGANSDTEKIISQSTSYRVISQKHGIYEVHGLSEEQIRKAAPGLKVEANKVYQRLIPGKSSHDNVKLDVLFDEEEQELPPILAGCDMTNEEKPTAEIGLNNDSLNEQGTSELGRVIDFNSDESKAHANNPSTLEKRWEIFAPSRSQIEQGAVYASEDLKFTPDNVGFYQVALVVKDDKNACGVQVARFIVSWNPEIDLPQSDEERPSADLEHFRHLQKVDAEQAWEKATGKGVVIAVLDTGLNYNHNAIRFNLAVNNNELGGASDTDNDNNEFKNDVLGWDFVNDDNKPYDDEGHGSHVSGLAASHIFGLAPEAKIMPLKVLNGAGGGDVGSILAGIYYAADNGATVINGSLGASLESFQMLKEGLEYANTKGVVAIISAGNGDSQGIGMDLGKPGIDIWPAELDVANIVSIAATDENDALTSYSNYGDKEVHVAAPGGSPTEPLWSLATQNAAGHSFAPSMGTSMSAPVVAGIAALVQEVAPELKPKEIKKTLIKSGRNIEELEDKLVSEKVVSALDAINIASPLLF